MEFGFPSQVMSLAEGAVVVLGNGWAGLVLTRVMTAQVVAARFVAVA